MFNKSANLNIISFDSEIIIKHDKQPCTGQVKEMSPSLHIYSKYLLDLTYLNLHLVDSCNM